MVRDSMPELLKRLLLQTGLTDISENTPGEGACHIHVLRFKSIRREKLLPTKDEYWPPLECTKIYWRCVPNCILHIFSALVRSNGVV